MDALAISIHPPREGWDYGHLEREFAEDHFNPPTP